MLTEADEEAREGLSDRVIGDVREILSSYADREGMPGFHTSRESWLTLPNCRPSRLPRAPRSRMEWPDRSALIL